MPSATGYSLIGPSAPSSGVPSAIYTVALTPAGGTVGSPVTITPSVSGGTLLGFAVPATLQLTTAVPSGVFSFVPTSAPGSSGFLGSTNGGGLTDPGAIAVSVQGSQAAMQSVAGDAVTPPRNQKLSLIPGTIAHILHPIARLPAPLASCVLTLKLADTNTQAFLEVSGLLADVGTPQADGTYSAAALFVLTPNQTSSLPTANSFRAAIQVTTILGDTSLTTFRNSWESSAGGRAG